MIAPPLPKGYTNPVLLGRGAFSEVWRLKCLALDRWVAWKVFHQGDRSRQIQEAQQMASRRLSVTPQIFRTGKWKGRHFLEMEWVQGLSLAELLPLLPDHKEWRAELFLRLENSLRELHQMDVSHGDLQPGNILFPAASLAMLLDPGGGTLLAQGAPRYRDPSLGPGAPASVAGDLYSLGQIEKELVPAQTGVSGVLCENFGQDTHGLDLWLRDRFSLSMGRRCAQTAEALHIRNPIQAVDLCQEALQWDPNQAQAMSLLGTIQLSPRRSLWKSLAIAAFCLILAVVIFVAQGARSSLRGPSQPISIRPPVIVELLRAPVDSMTSLRSSASGTFLGASPHPEASGWLLAQGIPASCHLTVDQESHALEGRVALPAGPHLLHLHCSDHPVQSASMVIRAFAETRLPQGFVHAEP
jgi:serine/threonine protein kinase